MCIRDSHGSLRLSLGADNTEADVDYLLKEVLAVVSYLREMSPVWDKAAQRPTWDLTACELEYRKENSSCFIQTR